MAHTFHSPFFPVPSVSTPLDTPLLRFLPRPFGTRAGNVLANGPAANVAVTTNGKLSYKQSRLEEFLGRKGSIHKAGAWWLVLGSDGTGVFLDQHPKSPTSMWVTVIPVAVKWHRKATHDGRTRNLGWYDLHDAMENPDLPAGFGEAVRDALAIELDAWGEACSAAPLIAPGRNPIEGVAPDGRIPGWFLPNTTWTALDQAKLTMACDTLAQGIYNTIQPNGSVSVLIQGACVDGTGTFHDACSIVSTGDKAQDKFWAGQIDAAIATGWTWWPKERRMGPYRREGAGSAATKGLTAHGRLKVIRGMQSLLNNEEDALANAS